MNQLVPVIKIFLLLCLIGGILFFVLKHIYVKKFNQLLIEISNVPLDSLPELSSTYEIYLREQYNVEINDLTYEERVRYIAAHYKNMHSNYKKYFPKGRNWVIIAAAANLGEQVRAKYTADWSMSDTEIPIPLLKITLSDKKNSYCEIFAAFYMQMCYDQDINYIQKECLDIGKD